MADLTRITLNDNSVMNVKLRCSNMFGSVENVNKECLLSSMQ